MRNHKVAPRYAKAFFDLACERKKIDAVSKDLNDIAALVSQSKELTEFLKNPTISTEKHKNVIKELFQRRIDNFTLTFLLFLTERKKISQLDLICIAFKKYYSKLKGILRVKLVSAHPLNRDQIQKITKKLNRTFNREIEAAVDVRKDLLGGFKLQIEDQIYDFSIQSQLEQFRQRVLTV